MCKGKVLPHSGKVRYVSAEITITGRGRKLIEAFDVYRKYLAEACAHYKVQLHAYIILEDQLHMLMTQLYDPSIPALMGSVKRRYLKYRAENGQCNLAEERQSYKIIKVEDERILEWYRFIEQIQVEQGVTHNAIESRWSSHRNNAYGFTDPLVTPHARYLELDDYDYDRQKIYRKMFDKNGQNERKGRRRRKKAVADID